MIRAAVLTVSDSAAAGTAADLSGPAICRRCEELSWSIASVATEADDRDAIAERLRHWCDNEIASVILTTGGTGVALRDITPEATRDVIDREIPGIAELMRARGLEQTSFSVLSRAVVGTRNRTLIVNLPGSPRGALHSLSIVETLVPHIVDLLNGRTAHSGEDRMRH
ncbi:MAG: MogA/MoaB family molybdenum cofactor biosynthesis protein [Acidobacteriaceae bacterium]|nr:MogA/MoaB family molybdenum cofactor biosynthesis protein [Acidobacteriaceae bacterium]